MLTKKTQQLKAKRIKKTYYSNTATKIYSDFNMISQVNFQSKEYYLRKKKIFFHNDKRVGFC